MLIRRPAAIGLQPTITAGPELPARKLACVGCGSVFVPWRLGGDVSLSQPVSFPDATVRSGRPRVVVLRQLCDDSFRGVTVALVEVTAVAKPTPHSDCLSPVA